MLTLLVLAWKAGVTKTMHVSECSVIGGLQQFVLHIIQDSLMAFWTVCMLINLTSIHGKPMIDFKTYSITNSSKIKYAAAFACSGLIILLNSLTLKLNRTMCAGSNYEIVKNAIYYKEEYVSMYTHWLLTLFNMGAFGVGITAGCYILFSQF